MKNKKKRMKRYMVYIAALALAACSGAKTADEDEAGVATMLPDESNEVTVQVLEKKVFEHELVSNGKLVAGKQADLHFETAGVVVAVHVKNGERVQAGQVMAELDKFRLANQVAQTKDALEKARLELQDVLIGQGYAADAQEEVPADVMRLARVRSGYDQAEAQYALAKYEEEHASLKAPFDGVVANLFAKPYNETDASEAFCTVVGTEGMEVDFTVQKAVCPMQVEHRHLVSLHLHPEGVTEQSGIQWQSFCHQLPCLRKVLIHFSFLAARSAACQHGQSHY